ncbi:MAG: hypothetical protein MJY47_00850 [Fibrobacter sp.]|nr:hypothetical protein [Fibrobacter sp.]
MESLLILIGIFVVNAVIKSMAAKKKSSSERNHLPPTRRMSSENDEGDGLDETEQSPNAEPHSAPRNLQDLIRQFQEAQRQASQGTYVPPTPPVKDDDEDDENERPVVRPANPSHFSFKEIAESVVQWEEASVDYLQDAFGFSKATALNVLEELQKHKIVGRDMGDGFCDVLVHDKVELANLFKREQAEAKKAMQEELARKKAELQSKWMHKAETPKAPIETIAVNGGDAELDRQRKLNKLEARAREARENAGTSNNGIAGDGISGESDANAENWPHIRLSRNIVDIRRGFIWAKVIDEPRFKRRWSPHTR